MKDELLKRYDKYKSRISPERFEKIKKILERYERLKSMISPVGFERFKGLFEFVESNDEWFISPASTRHDHHLAEISGLLEHNVNVAEYVLKLKDTIFPKISTDSAILVGLFHDLGKTGLPGKPLYIENTDPDTKSEKPYKHNPNLLYISVPFRSVQLLSEYLHLTEEEAQAIAYHDGQFIQENKKVAHKECALTLIVHFADYWCASMVEKNISF